MDGKQSVLGVAHLIHQNNENNLEKAMPEKTPLDYTALQYLLVMILGAIGGLVARLQIIVGIGVHCWKCAAGRLAVDACTSGFCGLLAFWACESISMKPLLTAVIIGITGHMGSRALFLAEQILAKKCKNMSD
jgi:hypothetical protein